MNACSIAIALFLACVACQSSSRASSTAEGGPPQGSPDAAAAPSGLAAVAATHEAGPSDASSAPNPAEVPVTVRNIGMHIGGGPNDPATKAPIAESVSPHFDELRACWQNVDGPARGGTFGVDLLVPAAGGRAEVSHPRTALRGDAFRDCVVAVLEKIDFAKPRGGRTTVSYSLEFAPR
jgi:hypothetical protein